MIETNKFKFTTAIRVRNYEVDWQGMVHNAIYLHYFEVGRIEYLKQLKVKIDLMAVQRESKIVVARNEIDYRSSARFDELLTVGTRIAYIRRTSFAFEGYIERASSRERVAENVSVHVWLEPRTNEPVLVNDLFRKNVQTYEGNNVIIEWPTVYT